MSKRTDHPNQEFWATLTEQQEDYFNEAEHYHKEWRDKASVKGGDLADDAWVEMFPRELSALSEEKLIELECQICSLRYRLAEACLLENSQTDPFTNHEDAEAWVKLNLATAKMGEELVSAERRASQLRHMAYRAAVRLGKRAEKKGEQLPVEAARAVSVADLLPLPPRRNSRNLMARCPFHKEKTPSFTIYADGHFHCFGCGVHGRDAIDFVMQRDGLDFKSAVLSLAGGTR